MVEPRYLEERFERASVDEIRAHQLRTVSELLAEVQATNAFYGELWRSHGADIDRVTSLEEFTARIPFVTKSDFLADQQAQPPYGRRHERSLATPGGRLLSTTSGTSGRGQEVHLQTAREMEGMGQVYSYGYRWAGLQPGDDLALAMPLTMLGGGRLEFHGAQTYGLGVLAIGNYDAEHKVEVLRRFDPAGLVSITAYLGRLGAVLDGDPPAGMRAVMTGGEGAGFEWLLRLQDSWQAAVHDRYGSSQAGNDHAFTCEHGIGTVARPGMLHNIDPYVLAEVIDPATGRHVGDGEVGEIVVTILYRRDAPIIRCRMGDRAVYREPGYCACGRPFGGFEVASIGRMDDMRKVKGINVWPSAVDDVVFAFAAITDYQVVLETGPAGQERAALRIMADLSDPAAATLLREQLGQSVEERLGFRFAIEMAEPGSLAQVEWKAKRWIDRRDHMVGTVS
ncbi:MAG: phenylacetate-CoA ligase [Gaiellaceae bacterium]|nr:phenylacetate-CoA ligase [Gaiellaceae bacterium]